MTQSAETRRTLHTHTHTHVGCCRAFKQIGTICLAFVLSIFSTLSYADNAVTGSGTECVYSTLNTYTGPSTIKANWDPNTINLYWYNDDTQTSSNTCNYDGSISLPATNPTKTGYTFAGWEVGGAVPAGYTMLEYIQTSGTQWLNTGIKGYMNYTYEIDFQQTSASNYRNWGVFGQSSYVGPNMSLTWSTGFMVRWESTSGNSRGINNLAPVDTNRHVVKIANGEVYWDGVDRGRSEGHNSNYVINYNLFLGTINPGGTTPSSNASSKYYSYKVWDNNGVLIQHFVPAKNSSNVVGMYDTVSGTFFTNAGSGTFTAGPAIQ